MAKSAFAKIFKHGRSQAVRLPREFRMEGDRVRVRREGTAVILEPVAADLDDLFAEMDAIGAGETFLSGGREQPPMPRDKDLFE